MIELRGLNIKIKSEYNKLKNRLDRVFSDYIRLRDNYTCIVCGLKMQKGDRKCHNGHYMTRALSGLRWDEKNCNCQCSTCNTEHEYDHEPYRQKIIERYGKDIINILRSKKHNPGFKKSELTVMIEFYKKKIKELKNERNK